MSQIKIYTKDPCPYCVRAIRLFNDLNLEYEEVDLTGQDEEMLKMKKETGWMTMPIILIKGKVIGGYDDFKELVDSGKLKELL